jgi:hypothetical protein
VALYRVEDDELRARHFHRLFSVHGAARQELFIDAGDIHQQSQRHVHIDRGLVLNKHDQSAVIRERQVIVDPVVQHLVESVYLHYRIRRQVRTENGVIHLDQPLRVLREICNEQTVLIFTIGLSIHYMNPFVTYALPSLVYSVG